MKILIIDFLKISKRKVIISLIFPIVAGLILFSLFVFDEVLELGSNAIVNIICSFEEYLYNFILLPFTFVDSDFTPLVPSGIALIIVPLWWYFLSCVSIFVKEKRWKN